MLIISRKKFFLISGFIAVCTIALFLAEAYKLPAYAKKPTGVILIDAGHGYPDGGAIGMNGSIESTLNIKVSKLVKKRLISKGYSVIMTRETEDAVADEGKAMAKRKLSDMTKRLEIINSSGADILVSIHMNKFSDSRYRGAQVLYSANYKESELLAKNIQTEFCAIPENKSKRTHLKAPSSIYLMKNASIPAVIAECGFLSNFEEEQLLNNSQYQRKLANAIVEGIINYYKEANKN